LLATVPVRKGEKGQNTDHSARKFLIKIINLMGQGTTSLKTMEVRSEGDDKDTKNKTMEKNIPTKGGTDLTLREQRKERPIEPKCVGSGKAMFSVKKKRTFKGPDFHRSHSIMKRDAVVTACNKKTTV